MTTDSPTPDVQDEKPPLTCPTCGHLDSAHDVTGRRWCAVSAKSGGSRNCICSHEVQSSRVLSHY